MDQIRAGVEASLEDGWHVQHYVCVAAVERLTADGLEVGKVLFTAAEQGDYITEGLLIAADRLNYTAAEECE